jgi:hypothetical protein
LKFNETLKEIAQRTVLMHTLKVSVLINKTKSFKDFLLEKFCAQTKQKKPLK